MRRELQSQVDELLSKHRGLAVISETDTEVIVAGKLPFEASADGLETITGSFDIEIRIPNDYPKQLPQAKELGNQIDSDYEHRYTDGTLCLAVPIEERRVFAQQPTLLGFVDRLIVPYLYGYSFFKMYGYHPFDEAEHGYEGVLRHYMDFLELKNEVAALRVICFLFEHGYRGHHDCPCGSGLIVRKCHGPALRELHENHTSQTRRRDFIGILQFCAAKIEYGQLTMPDRLRNQVLRILNKTKLVKTN